MEYPCPECKEKVDVSEDQESDMKEDIPIECESCGAISFLWVGRLVDHDSLHEYRCESLASADYEERAYGNDCTEYYISDASKEDY